MFDLKNYPIKQKNPYSHHGYKAGVLGCALSHYTVWKKFTEMKEYSDDSYILVLEDDIELCDDFNEKIKNLLYELENDKKWGMTFIGFTDYKDFGDVKISDKLIRLSDQTRINGGGAFAYLIRKSAAKKLIENSKKYKIQQAIDFWMIEQFDDIISYKCHPELIFSAIANNIKGSDSDVQNSNQKIMNLN